MPPLACDPSEWKSIRRIAVFRALMLGDLLCAMPAIQALRGAVPHAEITLIGLPWAKAFASRYSHLFDAFLEFPGFPGLPERAVDVAGFPRFLSRMQDDPWDLVLQMHGSGNLVNSACELMGARATAGFFRPGEHCPDPARFMTYPDHVHEIERHLSLMRFLGIAADDVSIPFPLRREDLEEADDLLKGRSLKRFVCLHPGAQYSSRRWPVDRFAAVGDRLSQLGYDVVVTGTGEEAGLTAELRGHMRSPAIDLAGKTTLGGVVALLRKARLVVTNDTGMSHLAIAARTPSVVIGLGSDAERWAPLDRRRHRVVSTAVECQPCGHRHCPVAGFPCAAGVTAEEVLEAAIAQLERFPEERDAGSPAPRRWASAVV